MIASQQAQQGADISQMAAQHVMKLAPQVGPQAAILDFVNSPNGNVFMAKGGDWKWLGEIAQAASQGKQEEARRIAFSRGQAPQVSSQPQAAGGDAWEGLRQAGEAVPHAAAPWAVGEGKWDFRYGDAHHFVDVAQELFSKGDDEGGKNALAMANTALAIEKELQAPTTDDLKEYQFYVSQRKAAGAEPLSFFDYQLAQKKASATNITNTIGGGENESELMKQLAKTTGEEWGKLQVQGRKAAGLRQDLEALDVLIGSAPQGWLWGSDLGLGNWQGIKLSFPALGKWTSGGQAFQSIVQRLAPSLRVEGSGSTSDMEMAAFLDSLPRLGNQPVANKFIVEMLKAKAQLDIERSGIVDMAATGELKPAEARMKLNEINARSIMSKELRAAIARLNDEMQPNSGPSAGSVGGGRGGGGGGGW